MIANDTITQLRPKDNDVNSYRSMYISADQPYSKLYTRPKHDKIDHFLRTLNLMSVCITREQIMSDEQALQKHSSYYFLRNIELQKFLQVILLFLKRVKKIKYPGELKNLTLQQI